MSDVDRSENIPTDTDGRYVFNVPEGEVWYVEAAYPDNDDQFGTEVQVGIMPGDTSPDDIRLWNSDEDEAAGSRSEFSGARASPVSVDEYAYGGEKVVLEVYDADNDLVSLVLGMRRVA